MVGQELELERVVAEARADLVAHELVVAVPAHPDRGAYATDESRHVAPFATDVEEVAARRELDLSLFDERNPVLGVVVPVARAEVSLGAGPADADVAEPAARLRILDVAFGCVDIARSAPAPSQVQGERAVAPVEVRCSAGFGGRRSGIQRERTFCAAERLGRDDVGDHVHEAADRARAVQQRGRAAHHLEPRGSRRVHVDAVIARLTRLGA